MYHYVGELSLHATADGGKNIPLKSGFRGLLQRDSDYFDVMLDLESNWLEPGKSASVKVTFLSPEIAGAVLAEGESYALCEGTRQIGTLRLISDVWKRIDELVRIGQVYEAIVDHTSVGLGQQYCSAKA
jgi:hypothetical protein